MATRGTAETNLLSSPRRQSLRGGGHTDPPGLTKLPVRMESALAKTVSARLITSTGNKAPGITTLEPGIASGKRLLHRSSSGAVDVPSLGAAGIAQQPAPAPAAAAAPDSQPPACQSTEQLPVPGDLFAGEHAPGRHTHACVPAPASRAYATPHDWSVEQVQVSQMSEVYELPPILAEYCEMANRP